VSNTHSLYSVDPARSRLMSRVRPRDTAPEMRVRQPAHSLGFRFRLHRKDLPGTPDLVFPRYSKIIFVHGCFWHRHPGCKSASFPKSHQDFWEKKFMDNVERDQRKINELNKLGWDCLVIWSCQTKDDRFLCGTMRAFLHSQRRFGITCLPSQSDLRPFVQR
jgi:DNA mismatch endonuclease (patch repair protein)